MKEGNTSKDTRYQVKEPKYEGKMHIPYMHN